MDNDKLQGYTFPVPSFDTMFEKIYEITNVLREKDNCNYNSFFFLMDDLRYTDAALDVMVSDKVIKGTYLYYTTKAISATLINGAFVYITSYDHFKEFGFTYDSILVIPYKRDNPVKVRFVDDESRKNKTNESTRENS